MNINSDHYQFNVINNKLRQQLNSYYVNDLNLLQINLPLIKQIDPNNYIDLLNSVNFSLVNEYRSFQVITNPQVYIDQYLHNFRLDNETGLFCNRRLIVKSYDSVNVNLVNDFDFLEIKIKIPDNNRLYIIDVFNQFWLLIINFINNQGLIKNNYYYNLTLVNNPYVDLNISQSNTKSIKLTKDKLHALVYTHKIVLYYGKCYFNEHILDLNPTIDLNQVWSLFCVNGHNQVCLLMWGVFRDISILDTNHKVLSLTINYSLLLMIITGTKSISDLSQFYTVTIG